MFPHEHFVVAAIPVLAYVIVRDRSLPTLQLLGVVFLGSQFPDLIDKPLAHQFAILPSGRVFLHSLPVALLVLFVVGVYGWQTDRIRLSAAFVFAHLSHLLTDHTSALLSTTPQLPPELLWPLLPATPSPVTPSWGGPGGIYVLIWTAFSMAVLAVAVVVLARTERERIAISRAYLLKTTHRLYLSYYVAR